MSAQSKQNRRGFAGGAWLLCIARRGTARCNIELRQPHDAPALGIGKRSPDTFRVIFENRRVGHAPGMSPEIGVGIARDDMHMNMEYGLPRGGTVKLGHYDAIWLECRAHGSRHHLG